jgi:hypothetical protein
MARNCKLLLALAIGLALALPADTYAHWCSNIYRTYARIVVKPERQNINVPDGQTGELKVRVRNNFPYTMQHIQMRANPPAELDVTISPTEAEAENVQVYTGQEVTFTLTITRNGSGSDDVSSLGLEVRPEVEGFSDWRDMGDWWVDQAPSESDVRNSIANSASQSRALLNACLADLPSCPSCELDGVNQLIGMWGAIDGDFDNTSGGQYMRAGQALAIRLQFRNFNDPPRADAVQALVDTMSSASLDISRGTAAFFAAYGGSDAAAVSAIQTVANSDPSSTAQRMAKAAQLILGEDTNADVNACLNDGGENTKARAVCAAALGIMGDDDPVTNFLMPQVPDGNYDDSNYTKLYVSYMLNLVVFSRRGGPEGVNEVSFLDEEVVVDDTAPAAPTGLTVQPL